MVTIEYKTELPGTSFRAGSLYIVKGKICQLIFVLNRYFFIVLGERETYGPYSDTDLEKYLKNYDKSNPFPFYGIITLTSDAR